MNDNKINPKEYLESIVNGINDLYYKNCFNEFCDFFSDVSDKMKFLKNNNFVAWLVKYIESIKKNNNCELPKRVFRCRIIKTNELKMVDIENMIGFDENNSREPPLYKIKKGRCNTENEGTFYIADDAYTALVEVKPSYCDFISLAYFEPTKNLKIADFVDIRDSNTYYAKKLKDIFAVLYKDEIYYSISNFVTKLVKDNGFDGIKYHSSVACGSNYVIFNGSRDKFACEGSKIICAEQIIHHFYDMKENVSIKNNNKQSLTKDEAKKILDRMSKTFL